MDARKLQKQLENALVSGAETFYKFNGWDPATKTITFTELAQVMKERSNTIAQVYADHLHVPAMTSDDASTCVKCGFPITGDTFVVSDSLVYHIKCFTLVLR